ncbi:MAG: hypothetical protein A4E66_02107 [Syntrophus sp. PtaB.Bin001]|nr:MAG: hypothetical protein A4E66_02107 [Syntrophus sp. PtaB.Bin001]
MIGKLLMKIKNRVFWGMFGFLFLLCCCSFRYPDVINDIKYLKQDHTFYLSGVPADRTIVDDAVQKKLNEEYTRQYFSVWHQDNPRYTREEILWDFNKYGECPGYGENMRKRDRNWMDELKRNAGLDRYPNRRARGIVVENTDLRALPTNKPHFEGLDNGTGYPFDRLQVSTIAVNTPVYISHVSQDGAWMQVETSYYFGWVPARDVAVVDEAFIRSWQNGRYAVMITDPVPVYDEQGRFCFKAPLGAQFPILNEEETHLQVWIGVADENRRGVLKVSRISRENAAQRPLKMTRANLARVANALLNQPYGWGGFNQNRDCSAMTMDFFAPFGIWLPRNSGQQAHEAGRFIDLEQLSPAEKEEAILKYGVPYATLIWRKGHIMLYIGSYKGKALIFHNMWGVSTRDVWGRKGRRVVGHAAITTLRPGIELCSGRAASCDPLQRVLGMTLLLPDAKMPPSAISNP